MENYNCNVEIVGRKKSDIKNAINYCKKEGVYICHGIEPETEEKIEKKEKLDYALSHSVKECQETGAFSISELVKIPFFKSYV